MEQRRDSLGAGVRKDDVYYFEHPPRVLSYASCVGKKEGEGPLGDRFEVVGSDDHFGQETWEQAEKVMVPTSLQGAVQKVRLDPGEVGGVLGGDLLNQCVSTSYAVREFHSRFFGLYGACSTMGEGLILASMSLDGGFGDHAAVCASSHFCSAERQYRTPLEYGGQRPPTAQWTVTGAGAVILNTGGTGPCITHATVGKVVDKGIKDANNMGAAMAPAAADTISAHLKETGRSPNFYDLIITGDLGETGSTLLQDLLGQEGIHLANHVDCGCLIFDRQRQDVHAGGSGCGCCASVLTGYFLPQLAAGKWKNILFCPTGALHSPTAAAQGESIPGISHAVAISGKEG